MAEDTSLDVVTFDRDEIVRRYLRDYSFRNPEADTGPNTEPFIRAQTFADQQMVMMNNAIIAGRGMNVRNLRGDRLDAEGDSEGVFKRPAEGATGHVEIVASVGGGEIVAGDIAVEPVTKLRFQCTVTETYEDGDPVPIAGIDTGEETNLEAGTVLVWSNPRPGIGPKATVAVQNDGSGLTGGHPEETDEQRIERIIEKRGNPPASGNDAEYQDETQKVVGVPVEKAFTVPCILGPGTTGVSFTTRPANLGASRRPTSLQLATVEAWLKDALPADDGIFLFELLQQAVTVVYGITWTKAASGWADTTPWPPYVAADPVHATGTPTATALRATTTDGPIAAPQVGQTIALYNATKRKFSRKRIKTVTVVTPDESWDLTFETALSASDNYVPLSAQLICPWSDSLDSIVPTTLTYFAGLGPGEQVASFPDAGKRQRRQPESPDKWPSVVSNRLVVDVPTTVSDAELMLPSVPFATTVGTPGVSSYLIELVELVAFPQE